MTDGQKRSYPRYYSAKAKNASSSEEKQGGLPIIPAAPKTKNLAKGKPRKFPGENRAFLRSIRATTDGISVIKGAVFGPKNLLIPGVCASLARL